MKNSKPDSQGDKLAFQMSLHDNMRFLDAVPHLLHDILAIRDKFYPNYRTELDGERTLKIYDYSRIYSDWNEFEFEYQIKSLLEERGSKWRKDEYELFLHVFTDKRGLLPMEDLKWEVIMYLGDNEEGFSILDLDVDSTIKELKRYPAFQELISDLDCPDFRKKDTWETLYRKIQAKENL